MAFAVYRLLSFQGHARDPSSNIWSLKNTANACNTYPKLMRMQELLKLFLWTNCGVAFFVEQIKWIDKGCLQPLFVTSFRSFLEF